MKRILFFGLFLLLLAGNATAQERIELTQQEKNELTERIKEKLDDFQDELNIIANGKTTTTKKEAIRTALELFIGEGESYYYLDQEGQWRPHAPVQMQTSSRRSSKPKTQSMKSYLGALSRMRGNWYDQIVIDQADAVRVGSINRTADGQYVATATICQRFCGYRDGVLVINDYDIKTTKVYINRTVYQTPGGEVVIWEAKLGDFKVTETWH